MHFKCYFFTFQFQGSNFNPVPPMILFPAPTNDDDDEDLQGVDMSMLQQHAHLAFKKKKEEEKEKKVLCAQSKQIQLPKNRQVLRFLPKASSELRPPRAMGRLPQPMHSTRKCSDSKVFFCCFPGRYWGCKEETEQRIVDDAMPPMQLYTRDRTL